MSIIKKYRISIILILIIMCLFPYDPTLGKSIVAISYNNMIEMISIVPPIFILLGLLHVWVKQDTMMRWMGEHSGVIGIVISILLGSFAAGPLYAAFPIATMLLKKGSKLSNVLIFIGAWSTTKLPLLLFEISALGLNFTLIRLLINIPGILFMAFLIEKLLTKEDKEEIYKLANNSI